MPTIYGHSPKTKITVTLSPELVHQIDALTDTSKAGSRSRFHGKSCSHGLEKGTGTFFNKVAFEK